MNLTAHLRNSRSLVGMFIREISPHLTVVDGVWRDSKESAAALGFDQIVKLPTAASRPEGVDAGTSGSAFDFRARMELAAATSTGRSAVLDLALVPNTTVFPGLTEGDVRIFGDAFEVARLIIEAGSGDDDLDRAAVLLAWCEGAYRGNLRSATEGALGQRLQDPSYGDDFAARVPEDLLADLAAMRASGKPQLQQWAAAIGAGEEFIPNPHLSGRSIVIAVPDWLVGQTLIECKTIEPVTPSKLRDALLQLLGYALLDFDDAHHIRELAIWLPRRGALPTWSLDDLLGGDAELELPRLRAQFQEEFRERYWMREWDAGTWVPGTIHPTGGFTEYVSDRPFSHKWSRNGKLHREDGPALISGNHAWWYLDDECYYAVQGDGTQLWYRGHDLHREDGPAVIQADRTQLWYRNDRLHREDGPAAIYRNGDQVWYLDGQRHRDGGPAVTWADGSQEWYRDGQRHREDGPAVTEKDGTQKWYLDGELRRVLEHGNQEWYQNDRLHREDGPAVIQKDGTQLWLRYGSLHREDGPAIVGRRASGPELWLHGRQYKTEAGWERAKAKLHA